MATKLKNLRLTSVDMVRNGANQEADICLFKSADPAEPPEQPTERESNIFKRFIAWLRENPAEAEEQPVEKDYSTFGTLNAARENNEKLWQYTSALTESIRSIKEDNDLDKEEKLQMMQQSLGEFTEAMEDLLVALCGVSAKPESTMEKAEPEEEEEDLLWDDDEEDPAADEDEEFEDEDDIDEIEEV